MDFKNQRERQIYYYYLLVFITVQSVSSSIKFDGRLLGSSRKPFQKANKSFVAEFTPQLAGLGHLDDGILNLSTFLWFGNQDCIQSRTGLLTQNLAQDTVLHVHDLLLSFLCLFLLIASTAALRLHLGHSLGPQSLQFIVLHGVELIFLNF